MRPLLIGSTIVLVCCAAAAAARAEVSSSDVAATVDGRAVLVSDVERQLARMSGERAVEPQAMPLLKATALERLVDRLLVLSYLRQQNLLASADEVELAIQRLAKQLSQRERSLGDYYKQTGLTEDALRQMVEWQVSWDRFLEHYLTDANLERYFQQHQRHFDGTRLRVAHILLKVPPEDAGAQRRALERAKEIRQEIEADKISFQEAAQRYSQAPTAAEGGDLGWIERQQPMPESFTRAAFALEVDQISPPVASPFGVHLIRCQEVEAGKRTWQEVRPELERAIQEFLFRWAADRQRPNAQIHYTGAVPYFNPETKAIVE